MKRMASMLLILCLLVCILPVQASAYSYNIWLLDGDIQHVTLSHSKASPGTTVTVTPKTGYEITYLEVRQSDSDVSEPIKSNGLKRSFVMPDGRVDIVVFVQPLNGGAMKYPVVMVPAGNGVPVPDKSEAASGETVTISPNPADGIAFDHLQVEYRSAETGESYLFPEGTSFTVPDNLESGSSIVVVVYYKVAVDDGNGGGGNTGDNNDDNTDDDTGDINNGNIQHITNPDDNEFKADISLEDPAVMKLLLDEDELSSDKNILLWLSVKELPAPPEGEKTAISGIAANGGKEIASYLDITLLKQVDNNEPERIHETNGDVPITMELPSDAVPAGATRNSFSIIYYHNGVAKEIGATFNPTTRILSFKAREFSTYALAFKPNAGGSGNGGILDNVPRTGDISITIAGMIAILCGTVMLAGTTVCGKKRRS